LRTVAAIASWMLAIFAPMKEPPDRSGGPACSSRSPI